MTVQLVEVPTSTSIAIHLRRMHGYSDADSVAYVAAAHPTTLLTEHDKAHQQFGDATAVQHHHAQP